MGTVVKYAVVLLTLLGVLLAVLWAFQRRLIYLPSRGDVPRADEVIDGAREVTLETSDGLRLGAWFVPAGAPENDFAVLVANGNAGDRSLRAPLARALAGKGFAVLLFDYRGYGGNPGHPSEEGLALDVRAAHRFLVDQGVAEDRLLYFGESLGAGVVTELATEHPPAGLVLRSPFTDLAAVGRVHYPFLPVGALLRDRYPVVEHIGRVNVPTTVVYGSSDGIVPPEQSRAVAEAAAGQTTLVEIEGADHNDLALLNGRELIDAVVDLAGRIRQSS
jgi:alpha-beta hydrolase superfamily lysophospholipase